MQNRKFSSKPIMPPPRPQGIGEDSTGLITSFIRIVDEISREHHSSSLNRAAEQ